MKTQNLKKCLAMAIAVVMLFSMIPMSAVAASVDYVPHDDYYKVITKTDYELAPGIVESEIVLNNAAGSHRQVAHVVEVDPYNPYAKVMPSYNGMAEALDAKDYKVEVMSEQVAYAEANGYGNVVAAMNLSLSWYNSDYYSQHPELVGEPLGYLVMDGVYYENSNGKTSGAQTCLVINFDEKDGEARPADIPKTEIRSTSAAITGWEEQVIPANFGFLVKDGVNQNAKNHTTDAASRSFVGIKEDGTIVMVMNDGRQSPYSAGFNSYEMAEFMLSLGCVQAINGDGGGSSQFLSQRPGEEMEMHCIPSDGAARATTHGILVISSAPATGEFVRAQITTDDQYYTPGTSVQFNAIGTDLVGTPADIPADAVWQLADDTMGTIDNNGLFVSNGKTGEVTAQLIYNGEVTGEASINIVVPEIAFKQASLVLPYGEAAELSLNITTNEGLNTVTTKDGDIVFTLSDSAMGSIDGNIFTTTTDTSVTGGTLTAVVCGDTENAISVPVKFGKASEVLIDFENNYELVIDDSLLGGDADSDTTKEYYYGWHMGDIRIDQVYGFRWTGKKSYPTTIGVQMGKDMYLVDKSTGMVRNGDNALAVNVDWTSVTSMGSKQMNIWFPEPIDASEATTVGMWLYVPAVDNFQNSMSFRWCGYKKDGNIASITTQFSTIFSNKQGFSDEGWYYVSVDAVANNLQTIEYVQFIANDASASYYNPMSDYTFYMDDITVDYSDATIDRENPYFTDVTISNGDVDVALTDGYEVTSNTVTLFAQAVENTAKSNATGLDNSSVKVTVDGKEVTDGVSINAGGKISVVDLSLSDGVHTIRFEICDAQGNTGSVTRKLVVGSGKSDVRFELAEDYVLPPAGSIVYLNLVADDIANIDKITTKVRLDGCNDWELEGMEVAYGFDASYTVNANNEAFITFERTAADVDDTNVIAKLPVRVWMTSTYLNEEYIALGYVKDDPALQDKYYALTPYAMWLSDGVSIIHIFMDASEGIVTYTDGDTDTFSSEKYDITTELNRYRNSKNDGDANFYQDKASFHIHTPGEATDKAPTCTQAGYTGRIFCTGCSCDTVKRYSHECDTHDGCGSVIEWGETVEATGHNYEIIDGVLKCACGELYNGEKDGVLYADGVVVNGWIGDFYYRDGIKLVGAHGIDNVYYNFAQDGTCEGEITGHFFDEDAKVYRYAITGEAKAGWYMIDNEWYYFRNGTFEAATGSKYYFADFPYEFDETGRVLHVVWRKFGDSYRCYYGPSFYTGTKWGTWVTIDGNKYCFAPNGAAMTGYQVLRNSYNMPFAVHQFDSKGVYIGEAKDYTGFIKGFDGTRYVVNSVVQTGLHIIDGNYYYFSSSNGIMRTGEYRVIVANSNGLLTENTTFNFDAETGAAAEKPLNGIVEVNGNKYYYIDSVMQKGLHIIDGDYYYFSTNTGVMRTGEYRVTVVNSNGLLTKNTTFNFDAETGAAVEKPYNGIVDIDGNKYYYINNVMQKGLQLIDGSYYYFSTNTGIMRTGEYRVIVANSNGLLTKNTTFHFDAETGAAAEKPLDGIVEVDGNKYYYVNNTMQKGFQCVDGKYYYFSTNTGIMRTGEYRVTVVNSNGLLTKNTTFIFDAVNGYAVNADGTPVTAI